MKRRDASEVSEGNGSATAKERVAYRIMPFWSRVRVFRRRPVLWRWIANRRAHTAAVFSSTECLAVLKFTFADRKQKESVRPGRRSLSAPLGDGRVGCCVGIFPLCFFCFCFVFVDGRILICGRDRGPAVLCSPADGGRVPFLPRRSSLRPSLRLCRAVGGTMDQIQRIKRAFLRVFSNVVLMGSKIFLL